MAVFFRVSQATIDRRVEEYYGKNFQAIQQELREVRLVEIMKRGYDLQEAAEDFIKGTASFDDLKNFGWKDLELESMKLTSFSKDTILDLCNQYWGVSYDTKKKDIWGLTEKKYSSLSFKNAYDRYIEDNFVRPILLDCMGERLSISESSAVLISLGFNYLSSQITTLCVRIFGKGYTKVQQDVFEHPIASGFKQGKSAMQIAYDLGLCKPSDPKLVRRRAADFITRVASSLWNVKSVNQAILYWQTRILPSSIDIYTYGL